MKFKTFTRVPNENDLLMATFPVTGARFATVLQTDAAFASGIKRKQFAFMAIFALHYLLHLYLFLSFYQLVLLICVGLQEQTGELSYITAPQCKILTFSEIKLLFFHVKDGSRELDS